jgi:hypothetical protein
VNVCQHQIFFHYPLLDPIIFYPTTRNPLTIPRKRNPSRLPSVLDLPNKQVSVRITPGKPSTHNVPGLRWILEALMGGNLDAIDPIWFCGDPYGKP